MILSGKVYEEIRFFDLMTKLEEALDRKYGKLSWATFLKPDGTKEKFYE
jgi:hypothetical protein